MSKIFISTNRESAKVCFGRGESEKYVQFESLLQITTELSIQQITNSNIFFHLDFTNPDIEIDNQKDYLLYHSRTANLFHQKFKLKKYENHPGAFKDVFYILIDESVIDKYNAIKNILFPNNSSQIIGQIGLQFLESGDINKEQIQSILGKSYDDSIDNILTQNQAYHSKKYTKENTEDDDTTNLSNWYKLEKALKVNNG